MKLDKRLQGVKSSQVTKAFVKLYATEEELAKEICTTEMQCTRSIDLMGSLDTKREVVDYLEGLLSTIRSLPENSEVKFVYERGYSDVDYDMHIYEPVEIVVDTIEALQGKWRLEIACYKAYEKRKASYDELRKEFES